MPRVTQSVWGLKEKRRLFLSSAIGSVVGLALVPSAASAQSAAQPPASGATQVEDIVVTAERREESVQNVPMSITAVSAATIQKFDIQDFQDYAKDVPNLSFGMAVGGGGSSFGQGVAASLGFTIRGISGY